MSTKELVHHWFSIWDNGNFEDLPLANNFKHTSPYGIVDGKQAYMELIRANKEMFLSNTFTIHDELYDKNKACIRYTMHSKTDTLEVSEWIYTENNLIKEIVAYYNLQEEHVAGRGIDIDYRDLLQ